MPRIFISYSRQDKDRVRWIEVNLRHAGYDIFLDEQIRVSEDWEKRLEDEIAKCDALLVVWSEDSIKSSSYVCREVKAAMRFGKFILPVRIQTVLPPQEFAHLNVADLSDWEGNPLHVDWQRAIASLPEASPKISTPLSVARAIRLRLKEAGTATPNQLNMLDSTDVWENTLRTHSKLEFTRHLNGLIRDGFSIVSTGTDLAVLEKKPKLNVAFATFLAALGIFPFIIYRAMHRRRPKTERIKLILFEGGIPN
jgi:hypothetical protein